MIRLAMSWLVPVCLLPPTMTLTERNQHLTDAFVRPNDYALPNSDLQESVREFFPIIPRTSRTGSSSRGRSLPCGCLGGRVGNASREELPDMLRLKFFLHVRKCEVRFARVLGLTSNKYLSSSRVGRPVKNDSSGSLPMTLNANSRVSGSASVDSDSRCLLDPRSEWISNFMSRFPSNPFRSELSKSTVNFIRDCVIIRRNICTSMCPIASISAVTTANRTDS